MKVCMVSLFAVLKKIHKVVCKPFVLWADYDMKSRFRSMGVRTRIVKPLRIQGIENISIGSDVKIHVQTWLAAKPLTGAACCELVIEDGCFIGDFCHIWATRSIRIEKNVLIANHVYISDNMHGYEDVNVDIIDQPIVQKKDVVIGEGCWLGENVCIIGASVGKHCVIGANSVVTHDVPDFCVAAGAPAHIVKRYDSEAKVWRKTDKQGNFAGN